MKRQSSGAGATLMETKSSVAGAGAMLMKKNSSGAGAVSFLRRLRSPEIMHIANFGIITQAWNSSKTEFAICGKMSQCIQIQVHFAPMVTNKIPTSNGMVT